MKQIKKTIKGIECAIKELAELGREYYTTDKTLSVGVKIYFRDRGFIVKRSGSTMINTIISW